MMKQTALSLLPGAALFAAAPFTQAALVFSDGLSSGANWSIVGDTDTAATFGYDYGGDGIPAAPNGGDTVGLKLEANINDGAAAAVSAVRTFVSLGMPFRVTFDVWSNYEIAGSATTEFAGGGVGSNGAVALSGASLLVTGDGGSSRDIRLYKDDGEQFIESGQYNAGLASNNGSDPLIAGAILGAAPPASQGQAGSASDGASAFQWLTMQIDSDPGAGTAAFTILAGGNILEVGTVDANIGAPVNVDGAVSLTYADLFSSLADTPSLQFGIYDNVTVETIPEPSSVMLIGLGVAGIALRRRK